MIETIKEFETLHPKAVIVNYDIADKFGYGITYRTSKNTIERFAKNKGKYIEYPFIQQYLTLENSDYELFIIYRQEMFKLKKAADGINYSIEEKISNVSQSIYMDHVFNLIGNIKEPVVINQEFLKII